MDTVDIMMDLEIYAVSYLYECPWSLTIHNKVVTTVTEVINVKGYAIGYLW